MGFVAFLKFAIAIIPLLKDLFSFVREISQGDPAEFISRCHEVFGQVRSAQTTEEKQNAARKLQDLIHRGK